MIKALDDYCKDILSEKIPSGVHVKNAVSRFISDLNKDQENSWYFDESKVLHVINFIQSLKHSVGSHAGKQFILQPWQIFIVANLYGFYKKDGTRRYTTAYIELARKQGKTALVAALALYNLYAEGEAGPEVLIAANSKEQAGIAFEMTKNFALSIDPTNQEIRTLRHIIYLSNGIGSIKACAAEPDKLDGYNCSLGIIDEYHEARDSKVRDVIRSSMGMRENPLLLTITTAGFDKSLPCFDLHTVCIEILNGTKQDDSLFTIIYALDEDDDWKDSNNWIKANPNLGITLNEKWLSSQIQQAINSPSEEIGVKTKNLNIWCDSITVWIPDEYVVNATKPFTIEDFKGYDCYIGVDLAENIDMSAISYLFVKEDNYYFHTDFYMPEETVKKRTGIHGNLNLYKEWARRGCLKETPGNVTDYDYIIKDMLAVAAICNIKSVFYDKWNALGWAITCTNNGFNLVPFPQTNANFNGTTKEFERLILTGKVVLDINPIMRYCLANVELDIDKYGNVKPTRSSHVKKIDGVIAALQALASYMNEQSNYRGTNIY